VQAHDFIIPALIGAKQKIVKGPSSGDSTGKPHSSRLVALRFLLRQGNSTD